MYKSILSNWYNKFCNDKVECYKRKGNTLDIKNIADISSYYAYKSSITRALYKNNIFWGFKGVDDSDKKNARKESHDLVSKFIVQRYKKNNNKRFDMNEIYKLMSEVRKIYHKHNIDWYTYGNAQKFVSMSMKYFFILLDHFKYIKINGEDVFLGYNYCVVDRIIIKNEKKVTFNYSCWSKCDCLKVFKNFQSGLNNEYSSTYGNLFYYELKKWKK